MKKVLLATLGVLMIMPAMPAMADAVKGQKYYLKYLRPYFEYNGQDFSTQHIKAEWKSYFKKDAKKFIKKFSKKHPNAKEFLMSEKFQKIAPDVKDFAIKYAADSGELPSCN